MRAHLAGQLAAAPDAQPYAGPAAEPPRAPELAKLRYARTWRLRAGEPQLRWADADDKLEYAIVLKKRTIVQITPATGWKAMYFTNEGQLWQEDVACFALVENPASDGAPTREVVGLIAINSISEEPLVDAELASADFFPWFLGYCGPTQDPASFEEQARRLAGKQEQYARAATDPELLQKLKFMQHMRRFQQNRTDPNDEP